MSRTIELRWDCLECDTKGIRGRHKQCQNCGSPRGKAEMRMPIPPDNDGDGQVGAETVTDPELLKLARAGADWFCRHCNAGNRGNQDRCYTCGAPRYGDAEENHPDKRFSTDHLGFTTQKEREPAPGVGPVDDEGERQRRESRRAACLKANLAAQKQARELTKEKREKRRREEAEWEAEQAERRRIVEKNHRFAVMGGSVFAALLALMIGYGCWWASQTHPVEGTVAKSTWTQTVHIDTWTDTTVRKWEDSTREITEKKPINGSGARAGMEKVLSSCREEHHHYEQYQCGTKEEAYECGSNESYQGTCSKSESYSCGETCRDNGNGFATCSPKTCSRQVSYSCTKTRFVSKTCHRTVPKYCDRSIEETKCTYRTQEWRHSRNVPNSGTGPKTTWADPKLGVLEKSRRSAKYLVLVEYTDQGKKDNYKHKPSTESSYQKWATTGQDKKPVHLLINNLGGVSDLSLTPFPENP